VGEPVGSSISSLIEAAEQGDRSAAEALFGALYSELRRVARRELARHGGLVSLSATTLLHEAYLDIAARNGNGPSFPDRARFMSYAARVMRGLIIAQQADADGLYLRVFRPGLLEDWNVRVGILPVGEELQVGAPGPVLFSQQG
jgi:hypothetical protein